MLKEGRKFYAIPEESRIPEDKKDLVMEEISRLEGTISQLFPLPCKYGTCEPGQYSGLTIVDRLIDTEETRIGLPPEGEARKQIEDQADIAIEKELPVTLVGIYGTPRNLDRPELNSAQLADMASVMMVQAALDRVHSAHLAGAKYRMVDENLTALWLDVAQHQSGKDGVGHFKSIYKKYLKDRLRLLSVLEKEGLINTGATKIELFSESELYKSSCKKDQEDNFLDEHFFSECEKNRRAFLCYLDVTGDIIIKYYGPDDQAWIASKDDPERWENCRRDIENTPEYSAIKSIGWSGLIPPEMRKYYLGKFRKILGNAELGAEDEELLFHVATYLSSTLTKHNAGTLTEGITAGTPIIKVPLVRPVDGRPSTHQSLVPQRTLPRAGSGLKKRLSANNRAAWASLAVQGDKKLRLVDTEDFANLPGELIVPLQIYTVGPDNGAGSYLVDSAILLTDKMNN